MSEAQEVYKVVNLDHHHNKQLENRLNEYYRDNYELVAVKGGSFIFKKYELFDGELLSTEETKE